MIYPGKMIVVEGLEGAGKSTAVDSIIRFLDEKKIKVLKVREPGGTAIGEALRKILKEPSHQHTMSAKAELLLMYAARIQLLEEKIIPALKKGEWVVADRFELSTLAYQGGGRGLSMDFIHQLSNFALQGFEPDLILFLDISPEEGLQRVKLRGAYDRFEKEPLTFFNKIHAAYLEHIQALKQVRIINAAQAYAQVEQRIREALVQLLVDYA